MTSPDFTRVYCTSIDAHGHPTGVVPVLLAKGSEIRIGMVDLTTPECIEIPASSWRTRAHWEATGWTLIEPPIIAEALEARQAAHRRNLVPNPRGAVLTSPPATQASGAAYSVTPSATTRHDPRLHHFQDIEGPTLSVIQPSAAPVIEGMILDRIRAYAAAILFRLPPTADWARHRTTLASAVRVLGAPPAIVGHAIIIEHARGPRALRRRVHQLIAAIDYEHKIRSTT